MTLVMKGTENSLANFRKNSVESNQDRKPWYKKALNLMEKIRKTLVFTVHIQQKVLWFYISMRHTFWVQVFLKKEIKSIKKLK